MLRNDGTAETQMSAAILAIPAIREIGCTPCRSHARARARVGARNLYRLETRFIALRTETRTSLNLAFFGLQAEPPFCGERSAFFFAFPRSRCTSLDRDLFCLSLIYRYRKEKDFILAHAYARMKGKWGCPSAQWPGKPHPKHARFTERSTHTPYSKCTPDETHSRDTKKGDEGERP